MQIRLGRTLLMTTVFLALSLSSAFAFEPGRIVNRKGTDELYFVVKHEGDTITVRPIDRDKMLQSTVKFEERYNDQAETAALVGDDFYMGDEGVLQETNVQQVALFVGQQGIAMRVLTLGDAPAPGTQQMTDNAAPSNDFHPEAEQRGLWAKILGCQCCGSSN